MDSKGLKLSAIARTNIDDIMLHLEEVLSSISPNDQRPFVVKMCLMYGIEHFSLNTPLPIQQEKGAWEIGSIINGSDYLLAKHLIINELKEEVTDEKIIRNYMRLFIELGSTAIHRLIEDAQGHFEDSLLVKILNV